MSFTFSSLFMWSKVEKSDGWQIIVNPLGAEFRIRLFTHATAALGLAVSLI